MEYAYMVFMMCVIGYLIYASEQNRRKFWKSQEEFDKNFNKSWNSFGR